MTVSEINDKIQSLNARLDSYITDLQFTGGRIEESELQKRVDSIQRVILNDPGVQTVLAGADERERTQYIIAIRNGIEETNKLLEQFKNTETVAVKKDIISKVQKNANKDLKGVTDGILDVTNNASDMALKDDERINDLDRKIKTVENGLKYSERVQEIKDQLFIAGRAPTIAETVKEVDDIKKEMEKVGKQIGDINTVKNGNLIEKLEEYEDLISKGYLIEDDDVQNILKDIRKLAIDIDRIDSLDPTDTNMVNASENIPKTEKECKDAMLVTVWITSLQAKATDDSLAKKLRLDEEFVEARKQTIKSDFSKVLKASMVLSKFDPDKFESIKDFDCGYDDVKNYIEEALEGIKSCRAVEGKNPGDVKRYIADAKKLYDSYILAKTNPNQVTFNGKTKVLSGTGVDMTDETKAEAALTAIKGLGDDDEFKKEFNDKVKEEVEKALLAHPKPQYGRFKTFLYGLRKVVTFGLVKTPKEKYDMLYAETKNNKEVEITQNIIGENKEKRDNAKAEVKNDKDLFHKAAIQKVMELKQKLDPKKHKDQVLHKREKNDSFSR